MLTITRENTKKRKWFHLFPLWSHILAAFQRMSCYLYQWQLPCKHKNTCSVRICNRAKINRFNYINSVFLIIAGPFGGTRAAMQLRVFVGALGMIAVPKQVAIPVVNEALDEHGTPKNDKLNQELSMLLSHLYWATDALKSQAAKSPYPQHFPS